VNDVLWLDVHAGLIGRRSHTLVRSVARANAVGSTVLTPNKTPLRICDTAAAAAIPITAPIATGREVFGAQQG